MAGDADGAARLVLFLDECIPEEVADRLASLTIDRPERPRFIHLVECYRSGTRDEDWIAEMRSLGWLPLTADRGRSNRGTKLPAICRDLGVVHVALSPNVHALPPADKAIAIAACWLDIVDLWRNPTGCVHSLTFRDGRRGFKLVNRETGTTRRRLGPP